jgi:glycosyltransferase involved in cell wall biosynthesis
VFKIRNGSADRHHSGERNDELTDVFADGSGPHVLMITNHGVHEWQVVPGLPDTGGQNVYVNQFTEALIDLGYRVTIVNRGGYPHPVTGRPQEGAVAHPSGRARILYIEDGTPEFVPKEDMDEHITALTGDLEGRLAGEALRYDVIISHYWDGGKLGATINDRAPDRVPHVWVPHSLGALKKRNVDPSTWPGLRIDERIANEHDLIGRIDGAVSTSHAITETFVNDYGHRPAYFLPPCVDVARYRPRGDDECAAIWSFLEHHSEHTAQELRTRRIITEISRTDYTKRKDVLIRAFARIRDQMPGVLLIVALDERAGAPYEEAMAMIGSLELSRDVIVLGSVWDQLPCLYAITSVYCTPSVMEGFGMSAQEAAATAVPVVSSDLVPFVREYLLGPQPLQVSLDGTVGDRHLLVGSGATVVPADDVEGFAEALKMLLADPEASSEMGRRAFDITVPYFSWEARTRDLLDDLGIGSTGSP